MDFYSLDEKEEIKNFKFFFCDTTLRDGEQVSGIRYTPEQKVEIAQMLDKAGIESIDAGFAATSEEERLSIRKICDLGLKMRIMSMCRVIREDIDFASSCGVEGVILFIPGSDIHLKAKFGEDIPAVRKNIVQKAMDAIKYAKDKGLFVEFGVEDSTRTDFNVLLEILSQAEQEGADILGTTDTIGYLTPERTYNFIKKLVRNLKLPIGVHCHNDMGLATANTIAGLLAGGGYCSPTVNGMGERAGNASLEEVIMILKVLYNQDLKYDTKILGELSKTVEKYSGISMDIFKPIVGQNAYSHESGIHVHGMLKDINTYELFDPQLVGHSRKYEMGKHAGKHTIQHILKTNGFELSEEEVEDFWRHMKSNEKAGVYYSVEDVITEYKKLRR
ncbi:homocitrate synthase/isopropylmalate synthase family protein [Ruminiclostridium cellulolyticum]|uniref:Pyruvate carboxyltransferase n=1 Tax=Ruminiclostridium cellulolyticum (strain ATCC 35319 / DSM 5812 / JCM 6584 / H10) TaxID=394503 RepID=B8I2I3_RUMCH|nr:pyruvate carboxyltransferase [Ruminiclostridium cellulolyticum]ACL75976.1 pyruvate carboxyltransferase [Ruminiclostridium cellulolyticum H10]